MPKLDLPAEIMMMREELDLITGLPWMSQPAAAQKLLGGILDTLTVIVARLESEE